MTEEAITFAEYLERCEADEKPFLISWPEETRELARRMARTHLAAFLIQHHGVVLEYVPGEPEHREIARYSMEGWDKIVNVAVKEFLERI